MTLDYAWRERAMVPKRLKTRVLREYGSAADVVLRRLDGLSLPFGKNVDTEGLERIQTAVVIAASSDWHHVERLAVLAETEWRDVLVAAGLANEDWRDRVADALGPA
jgi:hypothetical protein